jgi:hypothetical protein
VKEWWASTLEARLSQGDVLDEVPVATLAYPPVALKKLTARAATQQWAETTDWSPARGDELTHCLARSRRAAVLVLSHSCDLDKEEKKQRVLVAPAFPLSALPARSRTSVEQQQRFSLMPLVDVPGLGDLYGDLRLATSIDRRILQDANRIASMSPTGVKRLQAQLVAFLVRLDITDPVE